AAFFFSFSLSEGGGVLLAVVVVVLGGVAGCEPAAVVVAGGVAGCEPAAAAVPAAAVPAAAVPAPPAPAAWVNFPSSRWVPGTIAEIGGMFWTGRLVPSGAVTPDSLYRPPTGTGMW